MPGPAHRPRPATAPVDGGTAALQARYHGRDRVWIPALRIDRSVASFPCDRAVPPDMLVYRWGCAGADNVYLLAHAGGPFRALHDAYVTHRLRAGLLVVYADGSSVVHVFAVRWWRLVLPTPDAAWAWAALDRPGMTLQTCVGTNSEYRLMVRLYQVA